MNKIPTDVAPERQVWEKPLEGTDIPERRLFLAVDDQGRISVHEAVLVQLLDAAGWERIQ